MCRRFVSGNKEKIEFIIIIIIVLDSIQMFYKFDSGMCRHFISEKKC